MFAPPIVRPPPGASAAVTAAAPGEGAAAVVGMAAGDGVDAGAAPASAFVTAAAPDDAGAAVGVTPPVGAGLPDNAPATATAPGEACGNDVGPEPLSNATGTTVEPVGGAAGLTGEERPTRALAM